MEYTSNVTPRRIAETGFLAAPVGVRQRDLKCHPWPEHVLIEPLKSELAFTLNPDRYVSGQVGTEEVGSLIGRFAPMRFHTIQSGKGEHLGYALLRPGESLRALSSDEGRLRLEITRKK